MKSYCIHKCCRTPPTDPPGNDNKPSSLRGKKGMLNTIETSCKAKNRLKVWLIRYMVAFYPFDLSMPHILIFFLPTNHNQLLTAPLHFEMKLLYFIKFTNDDFTYKLSTACMEIKRAGTLNVSKNISAAFSRFLLGFKGASVKSTGCWNTIQLILIIFGEL